MAVERRPRLNDDEWEAVKAMRKQKRESILHEQVDNLRASMQVATQDLSSLFDDDPQLEAGELDDHTPHAIAGKRIGIVSDVHVPFHSVLSLTAALRWLKQQNVDTLVLNGDIMDFYSASRHDKDRRRMQTFFAEMRTGQTIIKQIREYMGAHVDIVYVEGNHEERFDHYIMQRADLFKDFPEISVSGLLYLNDARVQYVNERKGCKAGKMNIMHGHEIAGGGINAARGNLLKTMANTVVGHHHRTQTATMPQFRGDPIGAWVTGCLCDLNPNWLRVNAWNHGFGFLEVEETGDFTFTNKIVIHGKVK